MARGPLPRATAWRAVARCFLTSMVMLGRREIHWPREHVGQVIHFADGTAARVYRETAVDGTPNDPCLLVVAFRLGRVRGRGHAVFRLESILNTPLFVGFPGLKSKLWLAHDSHGSYRGLYEWDGADKAEWYARSLWRVLELVSEHGSIDYKVLPGLRRDDVLAAPRVLNRYAPTEERAWWRVVIAARGAERTCWSWGPGRPGSPPRSKHTNAAPRFAWWNGDQSAFARPGR